MHSNIPHILIIEDNEDVRKTLRLLLEDLPAKITDIGHPDRVKNLLPQQTFDLILLDMNFSAGINSGNEGYFWMNQILKLDAHATIIFITAYGSVNQAVKAIKEGATDFITKPWDNDKLLSTVMAGLELNKSKRDLDQVKTQQKEINRVSRQDQPFVKCSSPKMKKLQSIIQKVSPTDANILITGENGSGKQLVASEIHLSSKYSTGPFLTVDLNIISPSLFESELFGHKKGAFTDAKEDRMGRFEAANGGTLFLDEIGNLSLELQSKLLTVIQNREAIPIGSTIPVNLKFRLITATNINLEKAVVDGVFREDLYFRLKTIQLEVPALRDRLEDIPLLANHFLAIQAKRYDKQLRFSKQVLSKMTKYAWPGNVRELEHSIEKAAILADSDLIQDLFLDTQSYHRKTQKVQTLHELEQDAIRSALKEHSGNIVQAAAALGITRQTIYNKIKKHGL